MLTKICSLSFVILILHLLAEGQIIQKDERLFRGHPLCLIENKGQITDEYGRSRNDIQFRIAAADGLNIFVGNGCLYYQFSKPQNMNRFSASTDGKKLCEDEQSVLFDMNRLDVVLEGGNPNPQIVTSDHLPFYEIWRTSSFHNEGVIAYSFEKVTYLNIYPFIDWVLYIKNNKLEYDFIIHPGGNVDDIKLKYNGATDISCTNKNVKVKTCMGEVTEEKLYAYEQNSGTNVEAEFTCKDNVIGFSLCKNTIEIDKDSQRSISGLAQPTIVIDPVLDWGTYYGGAGGDNAQYVTCFKSSIYMVGATNSISNIATIGAYKTVCGSGVDAFIAKFNTAGVIQWATYYGGNGNDIGYGVVNDTDGNVYLSGSTQSTDSIATMGAYQYVYGGGFYDGFLAKFDSGGLLQWATYFGGTDNDITYNVVCDSANNIYIGGTTYSTTNIATSGSYQSTIGGASDGFLSKFSASGVLQWSTYYGGSGFDIANRINCDRNGNIYVTGYTTSIDSIATAGAYKTTYQDADNDDVFLAKFSVDGSILWATYHGGFGNDVGNGISFDQTDNVYLTGQTSSYDRIATIDSHQDSLSGTNDAFLTKFDKDGHLQWSTYYGGIGNTYGRGIFNDGNGNVFVCGETTSVDKIATSGSYQSTCGGSTDAFLARFNDTGSLQWATYYGDSANDGGAAACFINGNVYMAGVTSSLHHIATVGAHQTVYGGGSQDAFLVKFSGFETGLKQINPLVNDLTIYPNPAKDNIYVQLNTNGSKQVTIFDITGRNVFDRRLNFLQGKINIPLSLLSGVYIVVVSNEQGDRRTAKLIVEK